MNNMNMQEASRVILGLRAAGWDEKEINDFILYIETGEEKYKPVQKNKPTEYVGKEETREGGLATAPPFKKIIAETEETRNV